MGEEFSGGGDEGKFFGFACREQALVEGAKNGIAAGGDECRHVEEGTNSAPATGDMALAAELAAIPIKARG